MQRITLYFPLLAILVSVLAFTHPESLRAYKDFIIPLLMIIMFGMGTTLTTEDFRQVLTRPGVILTGLLTQYSIMPLAAFLIASLLELEDTLKLGMVLVGATAGGTASNVITYLARGNVALSIVLTACSTLLAVLLMPAFTVLFASSSFEVPALSMLISILKIVILPVVAGLLLNRYFHRWTGPLNRVFPLVSMSAIIVIIGIIVSLNAERLAQTGILLSSAIILHNLTGFAAGYLIPYLLGFSRQDCKTISIETAMQNSGLSVAIAIKYFSPLAALPGALFSIWHNISGSLMASYWSRRSREL